MSVCVITCIFGKYIGTLCPSVKNYDAYFFTNNPEIKDIIEKSGWKYIYIDFPLSDDDIESKLQSKYIQYLQFSKNSTFNFFRKYERIIYIEHRLKLRDDHIEYLMGKMEDKKILVRKNPENINNIWEEAGDTIYENNYLQFMPQTIDYIIDKINEGYSEHPVFVWTSLIVYIHLDNKVMEFTDKIYNDIIKTGTYRCHIIWSLLSQNYTNIIKIIKWNEFDIDFIDTWGEKDETVKMCNLNENLLIKLNNIVEYIESFKHHNEEKLYKTDYIEQITESVGYYWEELQKKTDIIDRFLENDRLLKKELHNTTYNIDKVNDSANQLEGELQKRKVIIDNLVLAERRLNSINSYISNSKIWKIFIKFSNIGLKIFPLHSKRRLFIKNAFSFIRHPFGFFKT